MVRNRMTLVVHTRAQNQWIASWHNVMLLSFTSTAQTTNLIDGERVSYKLLEKYPRYATISIVDSNSRVPDAEMRRLSSESLTRTAKHQVGMATVLEGDGFWLAASRSALAGLLLVVKSPLPHKVFATAAEATRTKHQRVCAPRGASVQPASALSCVACSSYLDGQRGMIWSARNVPRSSMRPSTTTWMS